MAKGNDQESDRDFHFVMAAASYHLSHLSARAYALLAIVAGDDNFSPTEQALALIMRRDITALRDHISTFRIHRTGYEDRNLGPFRDRLGHDDNPRACGQ